MIILQYNFMISILMQEKSFGSDHGFPPCTMSPPADGRALKPQPAISPHSPRRHPRPRPAGNPRSRHLRLKPIISAHTFIPTGSTMNLLLTSPARLSRSVSRRQLTKHLSTTETDTPCNLECQRDFLTINLHH